jgi:hypothetical protein
MNELIFLGLCGFLVAGVLCRPDRFLFTYVRRREQEWFPEPYLGEFIPAETPAQRQQRESMAKLKRLLKKAEEGR